MSTATKTLKLALCGNQNAGKTTLFNRLTGSNQHVGNWPGVTVERKEGTLLKNKQITIVDLPGIYSLTPYTAEEIISRRVVLSDDVDAIINIVDATNLERNLYLTLQLAEVGKPMVVALNMMDEVRQNGDVIDVKALSKELGMPVIAISAKQNEGVDKLIHAVHEVVEQRKLPPIVDICSGNLHEAIHGVMLLIETRTGGIPVRFAATKLVEGDEDMRAQLKLNDHEIHVIEELVEIMEHRSGMERDAAIADARYRFIETLMTRTVRRHREVDAPNKSDKLDKIFTHRWLAFPVFFAVMVVVFYISFGPLGTWIADGFNTLLDGLSGAGASLLAHIGLPEEGWVYGLLVDGVFVGVTSVLGFLPPILLLFLCLSILEDSGYMARAAFLMDRPLRRIGLTGRAFIPMVMGFGCSVPAIAATRALSSDKDKRLTSWLTPFMSCGAKVPVYGLMVSAFFPNHRALAMVGLYGLGIAVAIVAGLFLQRLKLFQAASAPFIMELPTYRLPTVRNTALLLWDKARDFLKRAFTVIFAASVVIWLLQSFTPGLTRSAADSSDSILAYIGGGLAWLLMPLGFGTWQAASSLVSGLIAKESVIATMAIIYAQGDEGMLTHMMSTVFTPLAATAFLAFIVLYMPCMAAFAVMRRELGTKWALGGVLFQTGTAWVVSFLIYQIGRLFIH